MSRMLLAYLALALVGPAASAQNRIIIDDVGRNPVSERIQRTYPIGPAGDVEVTGISGSVEVVAVDGTTAAVDYSRKAATPTDLQCERLEIEHQGNSLRLRLQRNRGEECEIVRAQEVLRLSVPRGTSLALAGIGDSVRISGVRGRLQLASIGDSAQLDGVRQASIVSVGDSVRVRLDGLDAAGIQISSVGDRVTLQMPPQLGARLQIDSVGDRVRGIELAQDWHDGPGAVRTTLAGGGPLISISSVGDEVVIER